MSGMAGDQRSRRRYVQKERKRDPPRDTQRRIKMARQKQGAIRRLPESEMRYALGTRVYVKDYQKGFFFAKVQSQYDGKAQAGHPCVDRAV